MSAVRGLLVRCGHGGEGVEWRTTKRRKGVAVAALRQMRTNGSAAGMMTLESSTKLVRPFLPLQIFATLTSSILHSSRQME